MRRKAEVEVVLGRDSTSSGEVLEQDFTRERTCLIGQCDLRRKIPRTRSAPHHDVTIT